MGKIFDEFITYVKNGKLDEAKAFYARHLDIDISANDELAFRSACIHGHLDVAKWLLEIKPDINISANNEWAFRVACYHDHLIVAKWLLAIKPDIDISEYNNSAFNNSDLIIRKLLTHYIPYYDAECIKTINNIGKCSSLFNLI